MKTANFERHMHIVDSFLSIIVSNGPGVSLYIASNFVINYVLSIHYVLPNLPIQLSLLYPGHK